MLDTISSVKCPLYCRAHSNLILHLFAPFWSNSPVSWVAYLNLLNWKLLALLRYTYSLSYSPTSHSALPRLILTAPHVHFLLACGYRNDPTVANTRFNLQYPHLLTAIHTHNQCGSIDRGSPSSTLFVPACTPPFTHFLL
jgi:hypothetical protein